MCVLIVVCGADIARTCWIHRIKVLMQLKHALMKRIALCRTMKEARMQLAVGMDVGDGMLAAVLMGFDAHGKRFVWKHIVRLVDLHDLAALRDAIQRIRIAMAAAERSADILTPALADAAGPILRSLRAPFPDSMSRHDAPNERIAVLQDDVQLPEPLSLAALVEAPWLVHLQLLRDTTLRLACCRQQLPFCTEERILAAVRAMWQPGQLVHASVHEVADCFLPEQNTSLLSVTILCRLSPRMNKWRVVKLSQRPEWVCHAAASFLLLLLLSPCPGSFPLILE
jgi:hypothetical protein